MRKQVRRWWFGSVLAVLSMVLVVMVTSASPAAPQVDELRRTQLSTPGRFAAYPDIGVGTAGLVVAVWTEGANDVVKHKGPLKLAWVADSSPQWQTTTLDDNPVYDVASAVYVSGSSSTVHVVWSRFENILRYTTCTYNPPNFACNPSERILTADEEALQVDIVADDDGNPHVVWVEAVVENGVTRRKVYYSRKEAGSWRARQQVQASTDSEGPAIAYANGFIHLVWTEWLNLEHNDSQVRYCRRDLEDANWTRCQTPLEWPGSGYLARNLSIAADGNGNVYVVWDIVSEGSQSRRLYAISYKHSSDNGWSWRRTHAYPSGSLSGAGPGVEVFRSGEGDWGVEYIQYLRPQISLAISGTLKVPVLAWHAQVPDEQVIEPGSVQVAEDQAAIAIPHKVFWTYATQPGSDSSGVMYWRMTDDTDFYALSTNPCGEVDLSINSGTGRLVVVGDLAQVLNGGSPGDQLHVVYHEETGGDFWGVLYNNYANTTLTCLDIYMPVLFKNSNGGGQG
jgi:hypothetical protein